MSIIDDIKAKADANGDGKLSREDLDELRGKVPDDKIDELKKKADLNQDGKVSFDDIRDMNFGDLMNDAKNAIGGLFKS